MFFETIIARSTPNNGILQRILEKNIAEIDQIHILGKVSSQFIFY